MSKEKQIENKKFYVVHTTQGYWVGTYIFSEQLRHAKIYTSLHYANETAERLKGYNAKILEVDICLAEDRGGYGKQEWISVEERLPDAQGHFLIVDKEGQMNTAFYSLRFGWFSDFRKKNITHWMPLPEAPKGGE